MNGHVSSQTTSIGYQAIRPWKCSCFEQTGSSSTFVQQTMASFISCNRLKVREFLATRTIGSKLNNDF